MHLLITRTPLHLILPHMFKPAPGSNTDVEFPLSQRRAERIKDIVRALVRDVDLDKASVAAEAIIVCTKTCRMPEITGSNDTAIGWQSELDRITC